jgi:hypothetical protein
MRKRTFPMKIRASVETTILTWVSLAVGAIAGIAALVGIWR